MAAKKEPIEIKINGSNQAETIKNCLQAKITADTSKTTYDTLRESAVTIIKSKVFDHWKKTRDPECGKYKITIPDTDPIYVNISNISSKKKFTPLEAKQVLSEIGCKGKDVFKIQTTQEINQDIMKRPKIAKQILTMLQELETQLKASGELEPEQSLVNTTQYFAIEEHALPRLLAICEDTIPTQFETAVEKLKDPIVCSIT